MVWIFASWFLSSQTLQNFPSPHMVRGYAIGGGTKLRGSLWGTVQILLSSLLQCWDSDWIELFLWFRGASYCQGCCALHSWAPNLHIVTVEPSTYGMWQWMVLKIKCEGAQFIAGFFCPGEGRITIRPHEVPSVLTRAMGWFVVRKIRVHLPPKSYLLTGKAFIQYTQFFPST